MVSICRWMETHQLVKINLVMEMTGHQVRIWWFCSLPKAAGAIPVLNTNEAGTVAKMVFVQISKTYTVTASGGNYYIDGALKQH